jgi:septal ring factor EnvC (AmiA/AmiB activator)
MFRRDARRRCCRALEKTTRIDAIRGDTAVRRETMFDATIEDFDTAPTADEHTLASAWVAQDKAAEELLAVERDRLATAAAFGFAAGRVAAQRVESAAVSQLQAEAGVAESVIGELRNDLAVAESRIQELEEEAGVAESRIRELGHELAAWHKQHAALEGRLETAEESFYKSQRLVESHAKALAKGREHALAALGEDADKSKGLPALVEEMGIRLGDAEGRAADCEQWDSWVANRREDLRKAGLEGLVGPTGDVGLALKRLITQRAKAREAALAALGGGADESKALPSLIEELGVRLEVVWEKAANAAKSVQEEELKARCESMEAERRRERERMCSSLATIRHLTGAVRELTEQACGEVSP